MRQLDWYRKTIPRHTIGLFGAIFAIIVLSFGAAYFHTSHELEEQLDVVVLHEADLILRCARNGDFGAYEGRLRQDPRQVKPTGLFDNDRMRLSGNIDRWPAGLGLDRPPNGVFIVRNDQLPMEARSARAVARRLSDGKLLVLAWSTSDNDQTAHVVERGLIFGLVPAFMLALVASVVFGVGAQRRVKEMNKRVELIIAGDFQLRLPTYDTNDPLDELARIVNGMLDEIHVLVVNLAGVGDDIAHGLRTPLGRARIVLERARRKPRSVEDLETAMDRAISRIDLAISIVSALLRIREVEQARRMEAFGDVAIAELVDEVGELYGPLAEEKRLNLNVRIEAASTIQGDRDLLFEAVANLVDNAIKFTPALGEINVVLTSIDDRLVLRVSDTGPGVPESELSLLVQRFYRSDHNRSVRGLGLGLTLVAAIVKLHGFRLAILSPPGFTIEIEFGSYTE